MVGGPVFGPRSRLKRALFFAVAIVTVVASVALVFQISGCSTHSYLYRPAPAEMIPAEPELPKVQAEELQCLSDDAYSRLGNRDRLLRRHIDELRALLGGSDAEQ